MFYSRGTARRTLGLGPDALWDCRLKTIEDKREKRALLEGVSEVRPDDDLKFSFGSFTRASSPSDIPISSSPWRPLTSRDLCIEFKRRCTVLTRLRSAGLSGVIPPNSSRPSSPRLQPTTTLGDYKTTLGEPDELTQNLWTCYFMLLENGASRTGPGKMNT